MRSKFSDSLKAKWSEDRIPVGAKFSAPVQTSPGAHPAIYTAGTGFLSHPNPSTAEVIEEAELYIYPL